MWSRARDLELTPVVRWLALTQLHAHMCVYGALFIKYTEMEFAFNIYCFMLLSLLLLFFILFCTPSPPAFWLACASVFVETNHDGACKLYLDDWTFSVLLWLPPLLLPTSGRVVCATPRHDHWCSRVQWLAAKFRFFVCGNANASAGLHCCSSRCLLDLSLPSSATSSHTF